MGGPARDPVAELWCAVLTKAVRDAFNNVNWVEARAAIAWLKSYSEDFQTVCEYAGRHPQYVYKKLIKPLNKREEYLNGIKEGNYLSTLPGKWIQNNKTDGSPDLEFWNKLQKSETMHYVQ